MSRFFSVASSLGLQYYTVGSIHSAICPLRADWSRARVLPYWRRGEGKRVDDSKRRTPFERILKICPPPKKKKKKGRKMVTALRPENGRPSEVAATVRSVNLSLSLSPSPHPLSFSLSLCMRYAGLRRLSSNW